MLIATKAEIAAIASMPTNNVPMVSELSTPRTFSLV